MQTRAELQGSINQYLSNTRINLSKSERSVINWAMVDDHQSVLELACEQDNLIRHFQNQYRIRACGLCFDVELAQSLRCSLDQAEIMSSSCGDIPWQNDSFDRIILTNSLPYYLSLNVFLLEIYRVLAPGGKVVFALPGLKLNHLLHSLKPDSAVWKQFLLQMENAGFKDVRCNKTHFVQRCLIAHKY